MMYHRRKTDKPGAYFKYIVIGLLLAFAVFRHWGNRDVVIYPSPADTEITSAGGSDVAWLTGTLVKVRAACEILPLATDTIVTDAAGQTFVINQRSGLVLKLPRGEHAVSVAFEIPRFAAPGPAGVRFLSEYKCGFWQIRQESPTYLFEILGGDGDG